MDQSNITITDNTANPAPLGLFGFGMTTILLNLHNAGFYEMNSMILAMGFFYGGMAQIVAGVMEWKKKNTFGMTAFTSYGLFWLSLVVIIISGFARSTSDDGMIAYLLMWGIFTLILFFGTLRISKALQFVFATLTILFFLLAINHTLHNETLERITGYEGILCGASAIYTGAAGVLNEIYGKVVLPTGPVIKS